MTKFYVNPSLNIVMLDNDDKDIIATSGEEIGEGNNGDLDDMARERRNTIWDED